MKLVKSFTFIVAIVGSFLLAVTSHAQETLNFASTPGATIQFNGAAQSFQFNTSTSNNFVGSQWQIGSESGSQATGSAVNLFGVFGNGPFSYGAVSTTPIPFGTLQTATITDPSGALAINDGAGNFLTANVAWIDLDTFDYSGGINAWLVVNVTDVAYTGNNLDLKTLFADSPASMDLTFQFSPGMTLSDLSTGSGPYQTSFSSSISVVPEPTSVGCFLLGLCVLIFTRRFRQNSAFDSSHSTQFTNC